MYGTKDFSAAAFGSASSSVTSFNLNFRVDLLFSVGAEFAIILQLRSNFGGCFFDEGVTGGWKKSK